MSACYFPLQFIVAALALSLSREQRAAIDCAWQARVRIGGTPASRARSAISATRLKEVAERLLVAAANDAVFIRDRRVGRRSRLGGMLNFHYHEAA